MKKEVVEDNLGIQTESILKKKARHIVGHFNRATTEESLTEEREQAFRNKAINYEETKPEYYEWFEEEKSTHGKNIAFSDDSEAIYPEDRRNEDYEVKWEELTHCDCSSRPSYCFARLSKMWANTLMKAPGFFKMPLAKKLVEKITEEDMDVFLDEAIEALETDMIRLWGHTGGTVKFFKKDILKFKDFKESWDKFKERSEKKEEEIQPVKKFKFNAEAIEFKPKTIESSLKELNRKIEKLLECRPDYPLCIATPL